MFFYVWSRDKRLLNCYKGTFGLIFCFIFSVPIFWIFIISVWLNLQDYLGQLNCSPILFPVECQSAAVRAICNLEIKDVLSLLRLLRSKLNDEQLHIPVVQFFRENLPNLAVVRNEDGTHEVKRKEADGNLSMDQFDGRNLHVSLLRQLSMAYPDCSNAIPSFGGFGSSSKSSIFKSLLWHPFLKIYGAQVYFLWLALPKCWQWKQLSLVLKTCRSSNSYVMLFIYYLQQI